MTDPGFKSLFISDSDVDEEKEIEGMLPPLNQGASAVALRVSEKKSKTKPPSRFTEGSLLGAMETAGKILTDETLREIMKDRGIGTVASRPQIIEKLKSAAYISLKKRQIHPTEKGIQLIRSLPSRQLTSPELTGEWEYRLRQIERGQDSKLAFINDIKVFTENLVHDARKMSMSAEVAAIKSLGLCPLCGNDVIETKRAYTCTGNRQGCSLVIWKKIAGKSITAAQARRLLEKGRSGLLKGFRSKTGKPFSAGLVIREGRVEFEFVPKKDAKS